MRRANRTTLDELIQNAARRIDARDAPHVVSMDRSQIASNISATAQSSHLRPPWVVSAQADHGPSSEIVGKADHTRYSSFQSEGILNGRPTAPCADFKWEVNGTNQPSGNMEVPHRGEMGEGLHRTEFDVTPSVSRCCLSAEHPFSQQAQPTNISGTDPLIGGFHTTQGASAGAAGAGVGSFHYPNIQGTFGRSTPETNSLTQTYNNRAIPNWDASRLSHVNHTEYCNMSQGVEGAVKELPIPVCLTDANRRAALFMNTEKQTDVGSAPAENIGDPRGLVERILGKCLVPSVYSCDSTDPLSEKGTLYKHRDTETEINDEGVLNYLDSFQQETERLNRKVVHGAARSVPVAGNTHSPGSFLKPPRR